MSININANDIIYEHVWSKADKQLWLLTLLVNFGFLLNGLWLTVQEHSYMLCWLTTVSFERIWLLLVQCTFEKETSTITCRSHCSQEDCNTLTSIILCWWNNLAIGFTFLVSIMQSLHLQSFGIHTFNKMLHLWWPILWQWSLQRIHFISVSMATSNS